MLKSIAIGVQNTQIIPDEFLLFNSNELVQGFWRIAM